MVWMKGWQSCCSIITKTGGLGYEANQLKLGLIQVSVLHLDLGIQIFPAVVPLPTSCHNTCHCHVLITLIIQQAQCQEQDSNKPPHSGMSGITSTVAHPHGSVAKNLPAWSHLSSLSPGLFQAIGDCTCVKPTSLPPFSCLSECKNTIATGAHRKCGLR